MEKQIVTKKKQGVPKEKPFIVEKNNVPHEGKLSPMDKVVFSTLGIDEKLKFFNDKNLLWNDIEIPRQINEGELVHSIKLTGNSKAENIEINKWRLDQYLKEYPEFYPEKVLENCLRIINNNPQSMVYLRSQLENQRRLFRSFTQDWEEVIDGYTFFNHGYESVLFKINTGLQCDSATFINFIQNYCEGVIYAHYHPFLECEIKKIVRDEESIGVTEKEVDPLVLEHLSHKILLLESLGILEMLDKQIDKRFNLNRTQFANIIHAIITGTDKIKPGSVRKALSQNHHKGNSDPQTNLGKQKLKETLILLNLPDLVTED